MKKVVFFIILCFSIFGIPIFYFAKINTGVSLKYETEPGECISNISGIDLCKQIDYYQNMIIFCMIVLVVLLFMLKPLFKEK